MHGLYASLLGEPFGFETQQDGRLFNDLIPISGQPSNSSSGTGKVGLHTEDCYQPFMPDYLGLLCLRNTEKAVTLISSLWQIDIPNHISTVLFQEHFPVKTSCQTLTSTPLKRSILFGDAKGPYLRYGSIDRGACSDEMLATKLLINAHNGSDTISDCKVSLQNLDTPRRLTRLMRLRNRSQSGRRGFLKFKSL
jgi:hypothetical protein